MSTLKFFLDSDGGALAFRKLMDYADFDSSVYVSDAHSSMTALTADPPLVNASYTLDVQEISQAIVLVNPAATCDIDIYLGVESSNIPGWYAPIDNSYSLTEKGIIGVDTQGVHYLTLVVTASTGDVGVELVPIPYDETTATP